MWRVDAIEDTIMHCQLSTSLIISVRIRTIMTKGFFGNCTKRVYKHVLVTSIHLSLNIYLSRFKNSSSTPSSL